MIARKLTQPGKEIKSVMLGPQHTSRRWRFNVEKKNSLDKDAREYINRAGVKNAQGRQQISDYVRGLKSMGLWGLLACFPLRFRQNTEAGSTLYALGKAVVNGPTSFTATFGGNRTRGINGMVMSGGAGSLVSDNQPLVDDRFWIGACVQTTSGTNSVGRIMVDFGFSSINNENSSEVSVHFLEVDAQGFPPATVVLTGFASALAMCQFTFDGQEGESTGRKNGEARVTSNVVELDTSFSFTMSAGNFVGVMPFIFFANDYIPTDSEQVKFYNLYKSTLGQGLGLP